jgi:hypothetical protein
MLWWWWTTVLILSSMLSVSLGFFAGCAWQSSVGRWPDESTDDAFPTGAVEETRQKRGAPATGSELEAGP